MANVTLGEYKHLALAGTRGIALGVFDSQLQLSSIASFHSPFKARVMPLALFGRSPATVANR